MGQAISPVTKILGDIPGVNKLAGGIESGISKLNDSTGGVLGKVWGTAKKVGPMLALAGPEGEAAAGAIDMGAQAEDTLNTLKNPRKRQAEQQDATHPQDFKLSRFY